MCPSLCNCLTGDTGQLWGARHRRIVSRLREVLQAGEEEERLWTEEKGIDVESL